MLYDTFEVDGISVEIHYDETPRNPYIDWDQLSYIVWTNPPRNLDTSGHGEHDGRFENRRPEVIARWMTLFGGYAVAIPFRISDHGSHGWSVDIDVTYDTPSGYVVIDRDRADETNDVSACARAEFDGYAKYLRGEVYGYVVADGTPEEDSCWGYYGEEYAVEEATEAARYVATKRARRIGRERAYLLDPTAIVQW